MALDKPYQDIPGTTVFDGEMARKGFHLNQFCMSLQKEENRKAFFADELGYMNQWPMSEEQKQAVIDRDLTKLISLGGNIYYLVKITMAQGMSVAHAVSMMTDMSPDEYLEMMKNGGRSPDGNRYVGEQQNG
jgi:protocatechuate 4,5-dioxygenase alpha chain